MPQFAIWEIKDERPVRVRAAGIGLEKYLENWIEYDPDLVSEGLRIVGRQITLPSGRLDLLAVSPEGKWTVIEIKAGELASHVFTQALRYAESLANMPAQELRNRLNRLSEEDESFVYELLAAEETDTREIQILLVGVGATTIGLQRLTTYLAENYGVPIRLVVFTVYADSDGKKMLLREVTEQATAPAPKKGSYTIEKIQAMAEAKGSEEIFSEALQVAEDLNLYIRAWAASVTFNSPLDRSFTLVYVKPGAGNALLTGYSAPNFARLYPIAEEEVTDLLGRNWFSQDASGVRQFLAQLRSVFARIEDYQMEAEGD